CGYRTDRMDDWVRHEEINRPHDFWCCIICRRQGGGDPYLTHRSDKLLQHAKRVHGNVLPARTEGHIFGPDYHGNSTSGDCDLRFRMVFDAVLSGSNTQG